MSPTSAGLTRWSTSSATGSDSSDKRSAASRGPIRATSAASWSALGGVISIVLPGRFVAASTRGTPASGGGNAPSGTARAKMRRRTALAPEPSCQKGRLLAALLTTWKYVGLAALLGLGLGGIFLGCGLLFLAALLRRGLRTAVGLGI